MNDLLTQETATRHSVTANYWAGRYRGMFDD